MMKQITHEDARLLINAYEGLVEWCGLTKKSMHDSRIVDLRNYITQQEKQSKLLELYQEKEKCIGCVPRFTGSKILHPLVIHPNDKKYIGLLNQIQTLEEEMK
jgi:hypothetical protein